MRIASRSMAVANACLLVVATAATAQPPGGGRGPGGPGRFGGPGGPFGGVIGLMQLAEVRDEIELSQDQQDELRRLREAVEGEIRDEMQNLFQGMRDMTDEQRQARFAEIQARFQEIAKGVEGRLQQVLLPHQFDRLKQIELQSRLQRDGAAALTDGELAETLGLSEAQRDEIRQRAEQVQQDLQEKIRQLRLDARNQLLDVLTSEQRAKLNAMMGEEFEVPEFGFGPGRGGPFGRGRGGRGRDRGQDASRPAE